MSNVKDKLSASMRTVKAGEEARSQAGCSRNKDCAPQTGQKRRRRKPNPLCRVTCRKAAPSFSRPACGRTEFNFAGEPLCVMTHL